MQSTKTTQVWEFIPGCLLLIQACFMSGKYTNVLIYNIASNLMNILVVRIL